jgi:hypothetical protein
MYVIEFETMETVANISFDEEMHVRDPSQNISSLSGKQIRNRISQCDEDIVQQQLCVWG